jgi:hypothetical protein
MTDTTGPAGEPAATREVARDEAQSVAQDAAHAGRETAQTAKEQTGQVVSEATDQARQLFEQAREQLISQGHDQKGRATTGLRSLADDLQGMVDRGDGAPQGLAADLARQASTRVRDAADWLETREPGDIVDEVRSFARRRPGVFLLSAAAIGFVGGRLTRSLADEARKGSSNGNTAPRPTLEPAVTDDSATQALPRTGPGLTGTGYVETGYAEIADPVEPDVAPGYTVPPTGTSAGVPGRATEAEGGLS